MRVYSLAELRGKSHNIWLLVIVFALLALYPAYTIWRMLPFSADPWVVVDIILIGFSVVAGFQLVNQQKTAFRNIDLFLMLNVLAGSTVYTRFDVMEGNWQDVMYLSWNLVIVAILWLLTSFAKRRLDYFADAPISSQGFWSNLQRYFSHNMVGQVFVYSTVVLLNIAFLTTSKSSQIDGSSIDDATLEQSADAWLTDHPNTLQGLMKAPTGVHPGLSSALPTVSLLDAKTIFEQHSPAVVLISTSNSSGAGFLVTADGVVATSQHVLDGSNDAVVMMKSGEQYPISSILSCDKNKDYCLFKIDIQDAPFVTLGDSSKVAVGDPVVVIGHPYGNYFSLSNGLISKIHEYKKAGTLFQFTAPTSSGNSGGPVFNQYGQVIGIANSHIASKDAQNLNFATAVSALQRAINP